MALYIPGQGAAHAYLSRGAGPTYTSFTACFWIRFVTLANTTNPYQSLLAQASRIGLQVHYTGSALWSIGDTANDYDAGSGPSTGVWYHVAWVRNASAHTLYIDGVSTLTPTSADGITNDWHLGAWATPASNTQADFYIAGLKMWSGVQLTVEEIKAEARRLLPVRWANIWGFNPFSGSTTQELIGGTAWSVSAGSPSLVDGPPIGWGLSPALVQGLGGAPPAPLPGSAFVYLRAPHATPSTVVMRPGTLGGGSAFSQALAGAFGPSGVVARFTAATKAGSVALAGALVRLTATAKSGTITPAGALLKALSRALTATLTTAGALASSKVALKVLTGAVTSAGALVKATSRALAGTASSSGALVRQAGKVLTGATTPAGALVAIRTVLKALTGALAPAGALLRGTSRSLAAGLTSAGAAVKATSRALTGGMTPAGALASVKAFFKTLTGALTPAGALVRQAGKVAIGAITPAGALVRATLRSLTGTLTSSGALAAIRSVLKALTGAITPTGTLARSTGRALAGAIAPAATLARRTARGLTGAVASIGALTWSLGGGVARWVGLFVERILRPRSSTVSNVALSRTASSVVGVSFSVALVASVRFSAPGSLALSSPHATGVQFVVYGG